VTNFEDPYLGLSAGIKNYDLLILDLTLPGIDGLEVCKEIRQKYDIPIIISSARSDISDKVVGLQLGADDYLPKPYDPKEMYARITSLIRRYKKTSEVQEEVVDSAFRIDDKRHEIYFNNEALALTPAEYEILTYLIKQHSFSVSREQLVYNCKSLKEVVLKLLSSGIKPQTMRDATRGGLSAVLNEWAKFSKFDILVFEEKYQNQKDKPK